MKRVALVFGKKALIGVFSPISFQTEANFQRAIGLLECQACDFVYVVLDHFDADDKDAAEKYLNSFILHLEQRIQAKIFISASSRPHIEMFTDYIRQIPGEVCVSILARLDEKKRIEHELGIATIHMQYPVGIKANVILLAAD